MGVAAFDTISEMRRLRDAGFAQEQAEAITRSIHSGVTGGVATKADLETFRSEVREEISALRSEVREEIATLRSEVREEITAFRSEVRGEIATLRSEIVLVQSDLRWIKLIGGVIVAVLVLPWLAELAGVVLN